MYLYLNASMYTDICVYRCILACIQSCSSSSKVEPRPDNPTHMLKLACKNFFGILSCSLHPMSAPTANSFYWLAICN